MTENSIIGKLRDALSNSIDSECKVVYILAQTRKLLEAHPPNPLPFALKLYCHWALHVDLTKSGTTLRFLETVDVYVESLFAGNNDFHREQAMLREFVFLDSFRQQFRKFLQTYDLPSGICDEDDRWSEFLAHYAGVIEDGSISCEAKKANSLKLVSKVVFTKGRVAMDSENFHLPFRVNWRIILRSGNKLTLELAVSRPGGVELVGGIATLNH